MRKIIKACNLDTGVPRISRLESIYMYRMSNTLLEEAVRKWYLSKNNVLS